MSASGKISLSGLPRAELEALAERLLAENDALRQVVTGLKAEVATLKGVKGRPELKPSGMEKGAGSEPGATNRGRGGRGKADRLTVHEERVVEADVPAGSRFKGYEDFLVQDLVLRPHVVRLRRERWLTPDGRTVVAPMPAGITGHFGPEISIGKTLSLLGGTKIVSGAASSGATDSCRVPGGASSGFVADSRGSNFCDRGL